MYGRMDVWSITTPRSPTTDGPINAPDKMRASGPTLTSPNNSSPLPL